LKQIIDGKLYNTETADLIADNEFVDGNNRMSHGRATYLYKTKKGNFFSYHATCWQGEHPYITPLSIDEAKQVYEELNDENAADYKAVFDVDPEEA
jgi:hypothetical protein